MNMLIINVFEQKTQLLMVFPPFLLVLFYAEKRTKDLYIQWKNESYFMKRVVWLQFTYYQIIWAIKKQIV